MGLDRKAERVAGAGAAAVARRNTSAMSAMDDTTDSSNRDQRLREVPAGGDGDREASSGRH